MLFPIAKLVADDFRRREVSVVWLVALTVCTVGVAIALDGWRETLTRSGLNMLLLVYMGVGVVVWAAIKSRRPINPVNRYIGLGDVLFFPALTPLFPLRGFAWLLVACMAFSLVWWGAARAGNRPPENVPLVATSGIVTGVAIILNTFIR